MSQELLQLLERHRELAAAAEMVEMFLGDRIDRRFAAQFPNGSPKMLLNVLHCKQFGAMLRKSKLVITRGGRYAHKLSP